MNTGKLLSNGPPGKTVGKDGLSFIVTRNDVGMDGKQLVINSKHFNLTEYIPLCLWKIKKQTDCPLYRITFLYLDKATCVGRLFLEVKLKVNMWK